MLYGRLCRYRRIVEGLRAVIDDMDDDDGEAYEWVMRALQIMQEKLDQASEEYYQDRKEGKTYEWYGARRRDDDDD